MKVLKRFVWALCTVILFSFGGCSSFSNKVSAVSIEEYEWRINTVQTSKDGTVIACTKEMKPVYGDVLELDITCTAFRTHNGKTIHSNRFTIKVKPFR